MLKDKIIIIVMVIKIFFLMAISFPITFIVDKIHDYFEWKKYKKWCIIDKKLYGISEVEIKKKHLKKKVTQKEIDFYNKNSFN